MIVVAIIGILAAIAIPAYQDYTIRSRVAEAITALSAAKATVSENIANNGGVIATGACAGYTNQTTPTANVASTECTNTTGVVAATTTDKAGAFKLTMTPNVNADKTVTWVCSVPAANYKYAPAECRNTTAAAPAPAPAPAS